MNFEFDFFGIDRLFSVPLVDAAAAVQELPPDWIIVPLQNHRRSWLVLGCRRQDWRDESAALELANVIAARKLADCDGLALGVPQWMNDLQKRQLPAWISQAEESGEGRWADGRLPSFRWYLIPENRLPGVN
jgi:hypothetical protein